MTEPGLEHVLAQLWDQHAHLALARVVSLEAYAARLAGGQDDPAARHDAEWEAHKLAGALGSYGRPGSERASQLEAVLRGRPDADAVRSLVDALRHDVLAPR